MQWQFRQSCMDPVAYQRAAALHKRAMQRGVTMIYGHTYTEALSPTPPAPLNCVVGTHKNPHSGVRTHFATPACFACESHARLYSLERFWCVPQTPNAFHNVHARWHGRTAWGMHFRDIVIITVNLVGFGFGRRWLDWSRVCSPSEWAPNCYSMYYVHGVNMQAEATTQLCERDLL